jgi:uncharacterized membrane protein
MSSIKQRLVRWFRQNFDLIRLNQSHWQIQPKSCQGCLLSLLLFVAVFGLTIFITFKIYSLVFSTAIARLGIAPRLGLPLFIALLLGCFINLPLYVVGDEHGRRRYKLLPIWLLKWWCMPFNMSFYRTGFQAHTYIGLNVSGGLIPIVLALYQFHRTQPLAILIVTAIVALISYFWVIVVPGVMICFRYQHFWLVTIVAALAAMALVTGGVDRLDVPVAFAGGVLGTTIGGDLLHLRDVQAEKAATPLSIGGAGLDDGIALCGLYALMIAEWLPAVMAGLFAYFK